MIDLADCLEIVKPVTMFEDGYWYFQTHFCPGGDRGLLELHDGQFCKFFLDRFEHAFCTTSDYNSKPYAKDVVDIKRLQRIGWIKPMVQGLAKGVQCFEVTGLDGFSQNRFYVNFDQPYVVWLEPRRKAADCDYIFSTAYAAHPKHIRGKIKGGTRIL